MSSSKFLAGALLASAISAGAAHAGTITQTGSVPDSKTDYTTELSVTGGANATTYAGFNAALGTLTSVSVMYSVNGTETGTLTNNSASSQTFNFSSNSNLYIQNDGNSVGPAALTNYLASGLTLTEAVNRYTLAAGASTSILPTPNGFGTGMLNESTTFTDQTSLSEFIGKNFSLDLATLSGSTFAGGGGNITTALNTNEGGSLTIVYNYTPFAVGVPEPAAIAAFGVGLLGLTFVRLRKRA